MTAERLSFVWFEITERCQLECTHCYANSSPRGTHGTMANGDWLRVIDEAADIGTSSVQFIGGEPTLHPHFVEFVRHALDRNLGVEVFTNLVHIQPVQWEILSQPGVRLATSYYAGRKQHERITQRRGSYGRTTRNITEAVRRGIPLRVGLIDVLDGQRTLDARRTLEELGVTEINTDQLRQVGRGAGSADVPDVSQLCGACAYGKVAVSSVGDVWPCVFARWLQPLGNVRATSLAEIATAARLREVRATLLPVTPPAAKCSLDTKCAPAKQSPCKPNCPPSFHSPPKRCWPYYYERKK